jgi:plasmid maintenance system antidote protein VapI
MSMEAAISARGNDKMRGVTALTADMAIRFEKAFGVKADTLCRMQTAHDLAKARAHEHDIKVDRIAEAA